MYKSFISSKVQIGYILKSCCLTCITEKIKLFTGILSQASCISEEVFLKDFLFSGCLRCGTPFWWDHYSHLIWMYCQHPHPLQHGPGTPAELLINWRFDQEVCISSQASNSCSRCQNPVRESGQGHDCNSSVAGETTLLSSLVDSLVVFRKVIISGNHCYQKDYS